MSEINHNQPSRGLSLDGLERTMTFSLLYQQLWERLLGLVFFSKPLA